jgi:UPF0716 family protein affecting phage T7 exclusion
VLAGAIALIVLGIVIGIFFPVMFIATAVGIALLIVFFVGTSRRAHASAARSEEPSANSPE